MVSDLPSQKQEIHIPFLKRIAIICFAGLHCALLAGTSRFITKSQDFVIQDRCVYFYSAVESAYFRLILSFLI